VISLQIILLGLFGPVFKIVVEDYPLVVAHDQIGTVYRKLGNSEVEVESA
jgi:tartrate dehydratase beta subunit/fumarate hydratase class I family protein